MSTQEDGDTALLLYDGLQNAFIGSIERYGQPPIACYSKRMVITTLIEDYELTEKEARDRYEFEYLLSNHGEATPCFLNDDPPNVSGTIKS
jgi:hypothetical protein